MEYDKFVDNFSRYYSQFENTKGKVALIRKTLETIKNTELPSRDDWQLFKIRNFVNSENLDINLIYKNIWCKRDEENQLIVGTLCPYWSRGWRNICDDIFVSDQIDNFFFLVTQYIYRSYQINLILAISLTYNRECDFRGNKLWDYVLPTCDQEFHEFQNSINTNSNARIFRVKHYLEIINSLDIYVNRASFYYLKAKELYNKDFYEEAITNLDNTIDTIGQCIKKTLGLATLPRKDMIQFIAQEIHLNTKIQGDLEQLYILRCRFTSHPAQSKWWDFGEVYETNIDMFFESVKYVLVKMLQYETKNRKIDANPNSWSEWFNEHANTLFDAVWFHKLP